MHLQLSPSDPAGGRFQQPRIDFVTIAANELPCVNTLLYDGGAGPPLHEERY